ncbi:MAG: glycosyltransferase family 2 protein [Candidatus Dojkabacteria bacterium]|nr:glycosyltransferase family 2 protein [Candidatus Dojkabacteria bacterium]
MSKSDKIIKRIFEMLPGLISWFVITLPIWGGILIPEITAYFILSFNAFWVYKSLSSVLFFTIGFFKIRNSENIDWMSKLERLDDITRSIGLIDEEMNELTEKRFDEAEFDKKTRNKYPLIAKRVIFSFEKRKALRFLRAEAKELHSVRDDIKLDWQEIRHIIIIPFWKEPIEVLRRSMDRLAIQTFPNSHITVVLGAEARHPPAIEIAKKLKEEYKGKFEHVWTNNHVLTSDEIIGKASNMASCGKLAQKKIEELGWDKDKVTITSCDSDTQFHEKYFAYLTYLFVTDPDRHYHFYAAPMVFYANFWKVPFYSRVANTTFTINNIASSARIDKFIQISSYSFSWRLLESIDFWSVDIIPEDFHMFFKALYKFGDKVMTVPIHLKNLSDAAESIDHPGTIKNQYEQVKRWAWGVSDDGWMLRQFFISKKKSLYMFYRTFHTIWDHLTWSIISFILMFGANIPTLINKRFSMTVFGQKLPKVSSFMMTATSIAFILTLILDFFLKPRREKKISIFQAILEQFQWIAFPVTGLVFGAIPGLDAQTRLLFGKYMEYRLTEKH